MLPSSRIDGRQRFTRRYSCAIDNVIKTILELGLLQTDVCFYVRKNDIHSISILLFDFDWDIVKVGLNRYVVCGKATSGDGPTFECTGIR